MRPGGLKLTNTKTTETEIMPVILFVKGEQDYEGQEPDGTELMTEGTMRLTPDGCLISYEESALTGMEGTTTTFEIRGDQVLLTRTGKVNSQMIFEEGRRHTSLYETPMGDMTIDVLTSRLRHNMTEHGGLMEIRYSIALEHTVTGKSSFKIRVRERKRNTAWTHVPNTIIGKGDFQS